MIPRIGKSFLSSLIFVILSSSSSNFAYARQNSPEANSKYIERTVSNAQSRQFENRFHPSGYSGYSDAPYHNPEASPPDNGDNIGFMRGPPSDFPAFEDFPSRQPYNQPPHSGPVRHHGPNIQSHSYFESSPQGNSINNGPEYTDYGPSQHNPSLPQKTVEHSVSHHGHSGYSPQRPIVLKVSGLKSQNYYSSGKLPDGPPVFYAPSPDVKNRNKKRNSHNRPHRPANPETYISHGPSFDEYNQGPGGGQHLNDIHTPTGQGHIAQRPQGSPPVIVIDHDHGSLEYDVQHHDDHHPISQSDNPPISHNDNRPIVIDGQGHAETISHEDDRDRNDYDKNKRRNVAPFRRRHRPRRPQHQSAEGRGQSAEESSTSVETNVQTTIKQKKRLRPKTSSEIKHSRQQRSVHEPKKTQTNGTNDLVDPMLADGSESQSFWSTPFIMFDRYKKEGEISHEDEEHIAHEPNGSPTRDNNLTSRNQHHDSNSEEQRFFPSFPSPYLSALNPFSSPARAPLFPGPSSNRAPSRYHSSPNPFKFSAPALPNRGPSSLSSASHDRYHDNNLLGSGNFEVVRGGTYYGEDDGYHGGGGGGNSGAYHSSGDDDEGYYPPQGQNGHSSPYRGGGGDFFANFRDFADINPHSRSFSHNHEVRASGSGRSSTRKTAQNILDKIELEGASSGDSSLPQFSMEYDPMMATF